MILASMLRRHSLRGQRVAAVDAHALQLAGGAGGHGLVPVHHGEVVPQHDVAALWQMMRAEAE